MATKISKFDTTIIPNTIIYETSLSGTSNPATVLTDVTQGDAGSIISIDVSNSGNARIYFQISLNTASPANTSEPDIQLPINAGAATRVVIPEGIPFTNLSLWATAGGVASNTAAPQGAVIATILTT
jgi:hypothetical protein